MKLNQFSWRSVFFWRTRKVSWGIPKLHKRLSFIFLSAPSDKFLQRVRAPKPWWQKHFQEGFILPFSITKSIWWLSLLPFSSAAHLYAPATLLTRRFICSPFMRFTVFFFVFLFAVFVFYILKFLIATLLLVAKLLRGFCCTLLSLILF